MELNKGKKTNKKQTNLHVQYIIAWLHTNILTSVFLYINLIKIDKQIL